MLSHKQIRKQERTSTILHKDGLQAKSLPGGNHYAHNLNCVLHFYYFISVSVITEIGIALNTFYSNCGFFNLISFERNAYSCRLGFCLRYRSSIRPKGHFLMKLIARLSADHPISGGGGFVILQTRLINNDRSNVGPI